MKNRIKAILIAALCCFSCIVSQNNGSQSLVKRMNAVYALSAFPVVSGYKHFNSPDCTMPTLEALKVATIMPLAEHQIPKDAKILTTKEAISAALKRPFRHEMLHMFFPWYKKHIKLDEIILVNGNYYTVQDGMPISLAQYKEVTIRSGGCYAPKDYSAYLSLKAGNMQLPCVTFSYPTSTRRAFNYCQEQDIACIDLIYQQIIAKNPSVSVHLYGTCKGATNVLRFLAEKAEAGESLANINTAVLESPIISVQKALKKYPIHWLVRLLFPNYNPTAKTILEAKKMPSHVPIFLGRIKNDTMSTYEDNNVLIHHLNSIGSHNKTYMLTTQEADVSHGRMGKSRDFQKAVNAFYKMQGFPYRDVIDVHAQELLKQAAQDALQA